MLLAKQVRISLWVALTRYPNEAWEVIFGYDQEVALSSRAAQAVLQSIRYAEE